MSADESEEEAYAHFVEECAKGCSCREDLKPCDGCLSGGICDDIQADEPEYFHSDGDEY